MPQLWQRGIALYYAGRYRDCRLQFEAHRTVNPADVENAAWHFLCVARAESPARARAALLPVGPDARVPMRQVYEMLRGALEPAQVLAAGDAGPTAEFYAQLYVGLLRSPWRWATCSGYSRVPPPIDTPAPEATCTWSPRFTSRRCRSADALFAMAWHRSAALQLARVTRTSRSCDMVRAARQCRATGTMPHHLEHRREASRANPPFYCGFQMGVAVFRKPDLCERRESGPSPLTRGTRRAEGRRNTLHPSGNRSIVPKGLDGVEP